MVKEIVEKWEKNKYKLEEFFRTNTMNKYSSYESIVRKVFELVINDSDYEYENYNLDNMVVINHGDYQGTLIFIVPKDTYQPGVEDYLMTNSYYGSCSGCDTLQSIVSYDYDELPSEEQVKDLMTLALHLIQKMKPLTGEN